MNKLTQKQESEITGAVFGLHSSLINNSRSIMSGAIAKGNEPKNKFNFPLHHHIYELTGESGDREASDIGIDPEPLNNNQN